MPIILTKVTVRYPAASAIHSRWHPCLLTPAIALCFLGIGIPLAVVWWVFVSKQGVMSSVNALIPIDVADKEKADEVSMSPTIRTFMFL